MAITSAKPGGTYYQFDNVTNDGAILAFKIHEFKAEREITVRNRTSTVYPVVVDLVVLGKWDAASGKFGPCADRGKTVRREEIIGSGITGSLRKSNVTDDVICAMAWGENQNGGKPYVQANPVGPDILAAAIAVFTATAGDPYSAAERAANPAGSVVGAQPPVQPVQPAYVPPVQPVQQPAAVPAQAPAADAGLGPAPWGAPAAEQPAMAGAATNGAQAPTNSPW